MQSSTHRQRAIIIGGSMAGLVAAAVLSEFYTEVTLIERDKIPMEPVFRGGVPQSRHLHLLLPHGEDLLEKLIPGLGADLDALGAPRIKWGLDTRFRTPTGWMPVYESGIESHIASRISLEWLVRKHVLALPNVSLLQGQEVERLLASTNHRQVTGVVVKQRGTQLEENLLANLVVDASGRGSAAPDWLQALGYDQPQDTVVNSFLGYATRWYDMPADFKPDWTTLTIQAVPQMGITRQAAIFISEGRRAVVTLAGTNKDYPPTDEADFLAFAKSLAAPHIYDAIQQLIPTSPIYGYRRTTSRLRHFEKLPAMPRGFIVMGDAACAFNPIYGQGMTTAAIVATQLQGLLRRGVDVTANPLLFQKVLTQSVQQPWMMATGEDLRYPETEGEKPGVLGRMTQRYVDWVMQTMPYDKALCTDFLRVMTLQRPATLLMRPRHLLSIARHSVYKPAVQFEPARVSPLSTQPQG